MVALYIVIAAIALAIQLFIADRFEKVAFMKGYGKSVHAFAMCFWLGLIGCVYVAALPTKTKESEGAFAGSTLPGQAQEQKNFYRCRGIVVTSKCSAGNCTMCAESHLSLKHCKITSEIGTREIPICDNCIRKFEDNSSAF